ncbi:MAG: MFS transporter, partial [Alphaproteobacteria bacterium]
RALGALGAFVIANALASISSNYLWGRLSDHSSRRVLMLSGWIGAVVLALTSVLAIYRVEILNAAIVAPLLMFVLMIGYQGVRLGRATHIVDMADADRRASYTALSNTVIGTLMLAGGAFGAMAYSFGIEAVLASFSVMCVLAAILARGLREVQGLAPDGADQAR